MSFLKKHSDEIGSLAAIFGVLIGLVGFSMTIYQLWSTDRTLQATNSYQIQKDAREIISDISQDGLLSEALSGVVLDEQKQELLQRKLWRMSNFYLSVFRQHEAGGINGEFSEAFQSDFCQFVGSSLVSAEWKKMLSSNMISESHQNMRETWCG
jgi:hypothetical protein